MYLSSFVNIHSFGQIIKAGALFSELLLTSHDLGHSRLSVNWLPPAVPLAGPVLNTLDSLGGPGMQETFLKDPPLPVL